MKELKCPKCGSIFSVDEADYASILNQVKNQEFEAELNKRMAEMHSRHQTEQQLASAKAEQNFQQQLNRKAQELTTMEAEMARIRSEKDAEIAQLKTRLQNIATQKDNERTIALAAKDQAIATLNATIGQHEANLQIALLKKQREAQDIIQQKEQQIQRLQNNAELERSQAQIRENELIKRHQHELQAKQEMVEYQDGGRNTRNTLLHPLQPNASSRNAQRLLREGQRCFGRYQGRLHLPRFGRRYRICIHHVRDEERNGHHRHQAQERGLLQEAG